MPRSAIARDLDELKLITREKNRLQGGGPPEDWVSDRARWADWGIEMLSH
jgi:hypothetical protein